ncbi:hydroxyethylthiazole kinase [Kytococcus aerolatus]|uniref:Hydroxyethylthiazole kinase n=1 Tax=Kytococcus aerolatus TaxID=592308 RepID=A0A212TDF5_9MICO|nr:hydroxyethylthiazole kinase [Kytococcus aerolatus]SNC64107.1 hydroxyethylthiazole kinase [Kytococcus aerolatus]
MQHTHDAERRELPTHDLDADALADTWERLRTRAPLVQCLTNRVATALSANVLLAAGASPAMVDTPREARFFAGRADAVLVNLGTPTEESMQGIAEAVPGAVEAGTPWVLDPIGAGGLPWRSGIAQDLLGHRPTIIRGNASEVLGLGGGGGGRGADSTDRPESALPTARELAGRTGGAVAVSGEVDHLTDGERVVLLGHGHPWLTRVTGAGCALGALMAACSAVTEDPLLAAAAATAAYTLAAETSGATSCGPGSFVASLLDDLHLLEPEHLAGRVVL